MSGKQLKEKKKKKKHLGWNSAVRTLSKKKWVEETSALYKSFVTKTLASEGDLHSHVVCVFSLIVQAIWSHLVYVHQSDSTNHSVCTMTLIDPSVEPVSLCFEMALEQSPQCQDRCFSLCFWINKSQQGQRLHSHSVICEVIQIWNTGKWKMGFLYFGRVMVRLLCF